MAQTGQIGQALLAISACGLSIEKGSLPTAICGIVQPAYCVVVRQLQCVFSRPRSGVELCIAGYSVASIELLLLAVSTVKLRGVRAAFSLVWSTAGMGLADSITAAVNDVIDLCRGSGPGFR